MNNFLNVMRITRPILIATEAMKNFLITIGFEALKNWEKLNMERET